jgi:hypothetical protein
MFSKLSLSLVTTLALSAVGGTAHPNHIPTSTDEARARAEQVQITSATNQVSYRAISSTDEARALAGSIVQDPSPSPAIPTAVSSTDEARVAAGAVIAASVSRGTGSLVLAGIPGPHSPTSP